MARGWLEFQEVTFRHDGAPAPLFTDLGFRLETGWTAVIGANGAGKTTLLSLASGDLIPAGGRVLHATPVAACPQRVDEPPPGLAEALAIPDRKALAVFSRLGVGEDWARRWPTLSHGERKRAQVAYALRSEPLLLLLDEPTNHLDGGAREMLLSALGGFSGAGLLVSHDRDLMDALCRRCLFLSGGRVRIREGGYTEAVARIREEDERDRREWEKGKREAGRLAREAERRRREAERLSGRLSKRSISAKDHDAKEKVDRARLSGTDRRAMRRATNLTRRAERTARDAGPRPESARPTGIELSGERASRRTLLAYPAGEIPLGGERRLALPDLHVGPEDRIALTGPNGTGKSTLVRELVRSWGLPEERLLHLPQEIAEDDAARVLSLVRALPRKRQGEVFSVVARLGSEAERVLLTPRPSPGEVRKLLLALGLARSPWLLILDEPTNHLDLPSVECLQAALADCPAALLLVSHDMQFLKGLASRHWEIGEGPTLRAGGEFPSSGPPV